MAALPVIARVHDASVRLDVRCLLPDDESAIEAAVVEACGAARAR
jgi:hypothetical protein